MSAVKMCPSVFKVHFDDSQIASACRDHKKLRKNALLAWFAHSKQQMAIKPMKNRQVRS